MGSSELNTILQRKTSVGRQEHQARAMTVAKALRLTIAKIADETFDMSMSVIGFVSEKRNGEGCAELFEEGTLLAALDGLNRTRGAVVIDADIVGGLIQQQTMSRVSAPLGDTRKMTSTDAAMCAPLVDAIFARVPPQLEIEDEKNMMTGYTFGPRADEPRILSMWLEAPEFHVIRLTLDMAGGARQGQMVLILPCIEDRSLLETAEDGPDGEEGAANTPCLSEAVLSVPAQLQIVLCRLTRPLAEVETFAVGDILTLPQNSFPDAQIATSTGRVIGSGTIGQVDGIRAMRLKREPIYATQPRRRASDQSGLGLPTIQALPGQADHVDETFALTDHRSDTGDGLAGLDMPDISPEAGADLPDMGGLDLPDLDGAPALEMTDASLEAGLPDLGGLPDLEPPKEGLPDLDALPELDDLPDLASLPDLADLSPTG